MPAKSTGMTTSGGPNWLQYSSTASTDMFSVSSSMSTKAAFPPASSIQFAEAAKVRGVVSPVLPGPMERALIAR